MKVILILLSKSFQRKPSCFRSPLTTAIYPRSLKQHFCCKYVLFESSEGFFCDRRMPLPPYLTLRASVGANKWFQPGVRRAQHLLAYQLIPLGEPLLPLLTLRKPLLYLVLLRSLSRLTFNIFKIFFAFENLFEAGPGLTVPNWQLEGEAAPPMEHFVCSLFTCAFLPTTVSVKSLY